MTRFSALIGSSILALAGCGGSSPSFDALNVDANRLYDEVIKTSATNHSFASHAFRGGASYNGVAYGTLRDREAQQSAEFRAEVAVNVELENGRHTMRGNMSNFVTEDERQLSGVLNFDGNIFARPASTMLVASFETTMSGTIQSLGSSTFIPVESDIRGTAYGYNAEYMAGNFYDNGGAMGVSGSWVSER